jgi:hypothetical protein
MIDLDQPVQTGEHCGRARSQRCSNAGALAAMALAVALIAAAGGAVASHAWTSSRVDAITSRPVSSISAFAEVPTEIKFPKDGLTIGLTGHISIVNTEPRAIRINSLRADGLSGLTLSSVPLVSGARRYDVPPNGAVSIAVTLDLQCASEASISDAPLSLNLDSYALEGDDVNGVPQSVPLSIRPWRDAIDLTKVACSTS